MADSPKRQVDPRIASSRLMQSPQKRPKRIEASRNYLNASISSGRPAGKVELSDEKTSVNEGKVPATTTPETEITGMGRDQETRDPARTYQMVRPSISMPAELKNTLDAWAQAMRQQKSVARRRGGRRLSNEKITSSTIIRAAMQTVVERFDPDGFVLIECEEDLRAYFRDQLVRRRREK